MGIADAQGVDEDANVQTVDLLFDGVVGPQSFGNVEFDDLGFDMVDGLEVSCQVAEFFSDLGTYEHNVDADLRKHLGVGSTDPAGTAGYHTPLAQGVNVEGRIGGEKRLVRPVDDFEKQTTATVYYCYVAYLLDQSHFLERLGGGWDFAGTLWGNFHLQVV